MTTEKIIQEKTSSERTMHRNIHGEIHEEIHIGINTLKDIKRETFTEEKTQKYIQRRRYMERQKKNIG